MLIYYKKAGEPGRPHVITGSLQSMQELVEGYIECVPLTGGMIVVCNEEGRILGKPENVENFVGDIFVCREFKDELIGLTYDDINYCIARFG